MIGTQSYKIRSPSLPINMTPQKLLQFSTNECQIEVLLNDMIGG